MSKEMTIEDLARMVQEGFSEVTTTLSARIDEVENRLETKIDALAISLDEVKASVSGHDRRITNLEDFKRIAATKLSI